jgi:hypothetical protein
LSWVVDLSAAVLTAVAYVALIPLMTGVIQRACIAAGIGFDGYQNFLNHDTAPSTNFCYTSTRSRAASRRDARGAR